MKAPIVAVVITLSALLFTSCSRVPEPATYDYTHQQKMQSGHHWDVLATDIATEINKALVLGGHVNAPVYVRPTCGSEDTPCTPAETSTFDEAFRDLLITRLVDLGVPTRSVPDPETIVVHYKAQPVYHHAYRMRTLKPGLLTSISAGIIVLRNAPWELATMAIAGGIDAINAAYTSLDRYEVVVTTSMIVKDRFLYRDTSIYYINSDDSWHYNTAAKPAEIKLISGDQRAPTAPQEPDTPPAVPQAQHLEPLDTTTGI